MKVISRVKKDNNAKFTVLKLFGWKGKIMTIGSEVEIDDLGVQVNLCRKGSITPTDLPAIGQYLSLSAFTLPGQEAAYTCDVLEVVELLADDALDLMLKGTIIPRDQGQWRPFNRKLRQPRK